ncbi:HGxxPAAW family protein [Streptomyces melanogenes]|uniref:Integral membrane protein n=1 Tax=Streptomyces melanogenes TaxID=67326 RepID=A0ABZ1XGY7_9ACTN|nr:HGxxPAAW family protein [Streptomyces melanogenes]
MAGSSGGHGHTPAAWTGSIISFIGFCAASVFIVAANPVGFWAGTALTLLGAVVGGIMKMMGMGTPKESAEMAAAREEAGLKARARLAEAR